MSDAKDNPLASLEAEIELPVRMPILDPRTHKPLMDREKKGAYLELLAPDSAPAQKLDINKNREALSKLRAGRRGLLDEEGDDFISEQVEKLVAVTVGWKLVALDGSQIELPFSAAEAAKLYANPKLGWLRRQAWTFHNNEINFMSPSANS